MTQQLLIMTTGGCRPTSTAIKPATAYMAPTVGEPSEHTSPAAAIAAGWKLLAPPSQVCGGEFEWWFEREV